MIRTVSVFPLPSGSPRHHSGGSALRLLALALVGLMLAAPAHASSRIKDIADFEGVRDNPLVGYGLIVGLNGTGDKLTKGPRPGLLLHFQADSERSRPAVEEGLREGDP